MIKIPLTQGQVATVPNEWFEELNKHKWCAMWCNGSRIFYAVRNSPMVKGVRGRLILMHRVILNAPDGVFVDHVDHDGLNNCPPNIRLSTNAENGRNIGKQSNNTSGFKGVSWFSPGNKWVAKVSVNGEVKMRYCLEKLDAARAFNELALKYHGEFACLNVIQEDQCES